MAVASYFPRESPGCTLAAGGLASSREQESRALWLGTQQPELDFFKAWRAFFLRCRAVATVALLPIVARSERALSLRTCPPKRWN